MKMIFSILFCVMTSTAFGQADVSGAGNMDLILLKDIATPMQFIMKEGVISDCERAGSVSRCKMTGGKIIFNAGAGAEQIHTITRFAYSADLGRENPWEQYVYHFDQDVTSHSISVKTSSLLVLTVRDQDLSGQVQGYIQNRDFNLRHQVIAMRR